MDVTPFLHLEPAPRVLFQQLADRAQQVRFHVPQPDGGWRPVTWQQHADAVRDVTGWLQAVGFQPGERGAIFAPNRVEWMEAALGLQAASGVLVPVYASNTVEQLAYVLDHADARVVFVDTPGLLRRLGQAWAQLSGTVRQVVLLDDDLDPGRALDGVTAPGLAERTVRWQEVRAAGSARNRLNPQAFDRALQAIELDRPGLMLYTSGTSGPPKGVPLTHRNVAINGRDWLVNNAALVEAGDVDLLWLPMSHIFGFGEACLGNTLGFQTYLGDPLTVLKLLPQVRPHVLMSVPSIWDKLASQARAHGDAVGKLREITGGRLRFCLSGGAGLKREVKDLFLQAGLLIIEGYGLTECSPTLTLNRPDAFRFDSVGLPLPSVELRLDVDGEILARGPSVFTGYHKDPAATRQAFTADGWFRTGDVGRFTDDGFLQIVDRKKDILVTAGGKNIPPANLELRFSDDPLIAHAVVYGDGKPYLVAGIWLQPLTVEAARAQVGEAGLDAWLEAEVTRRVEAVNGQVARYETIKKFQIFRQPLTVEAGLLTPTFKVRRKQVYAAFGAELEAMYASGVSA